MLSHNYRIRIEAICEKIANRENVELNDMIFIEKLAAHNVTVAKFLRQARRKANNQNMKEGDLDDFLNQMDLGNPDPSSHRTQFNGPDDIADFFRNGDGMRRD